MTNILEIKGLNKQYENHKAVDSFSLDIPKACLFGILGPNGAGKTSLIRMITTITRPDSGQILFKGYPLKEEDTRLMGYMPEERGLYKKMEVAEQLIYLARLRGMTKIQAQSALNEWFDRLGMTEWRKKKVEELSKGMAQKVQFVSTVLHNPELLILDEPFSGLDPLNANLIKDEIYRLFSEGKTILFSTHRMEQVEEICQKIVLINNGKNILEGEVAEVKNRFKEHVFVLNFANQAVANHAKELANMVTGWHIINIKGQQLFIQLTSGGNITQVLTWIIQQNLELTGFNEVLPSLNEIFIKQVELAMA
jgi:ABC-2 type transport system ATP-binding protein